MSDACDASPPKIPSLIVGWAAPPEDRDEILGDLAELYSWRRPIGDADRWYWTESIVSTLIFLPGRMLGSTGARDVFGAMLGVVMILGSMLVLGLAGLGEAAVRAPAPWCYVLAHVFYGVPSLCGGLVVGRRSPRPWAGAAALLLGTAASTAVLLTGPAPSSGALTLYSGLALFAVRLGSRGRDSIPSEARA